MGDVPADDPQAAYEALIDDLVSRTPALSARLLRERSVVGMPEEDRAVNAIVARLSEEEREALAAFLERERAGAFHDVLAAFTEWSDGGLGRSYQGKQLCVGYEGGLHQDYVGRRMGWEWPPRGR